MEYWISHGGVAAKLNLGIVTYGRTFTLADPTNYSLYAPTVGGGLVGPYTQQIGILGYNEVYKFNY